MGGSEDRREVNELIDACMAMDVGGMAVVVDHCSVIVPAWFWYQVMTEEERSSELINAWLVTSVHDVDYFSIVVNDPSENIEYHVKSVTIMPSNLVAMADAVSATITASKERE